MSAKPRRRVAGARPALAVAALFLTLVVFSGCASSREIARGEAITAVRANAQALRDQIASAAPGTFGEAQLQAVRAVLPDQSLAAAPTREGVIVKGVLTAWAEAGGGLSYDVFYVRLCVGYDVTADSGDTQVADAPCPDNVDSTAPADETVSVAN